MKLSAIAVVVIVTAFAASSAPAQEAQFPHELKGYEFFKSGKLDGLKLLVSTKADVVRIMGKGCENGCDYDENWKIGFSYVNTGWSRTINEVLQRPKPAFIGKLAGITFHPRRPVVLTTENIFPDTFRSGNGITEWGGLKYRSRVCRDDKRVLYGIAAETVSDGTAMVMDQQIMHINYMPTEKAYEEIYALIDK